MVQRRVISSLPDNAQLDAEELRRQLTTRFALMLTIVGGAAVWLSTDPGLALNWRRTLIFLSLFLEGLVAYFVGSRHSRLAGAILLLGPTFSLVGALRVLRSPFVSPFAALIVLANWTISPVSGIAAAILNTLSFCALLPFDESLFSALALLWLAAGVEWGSSGALRTVLAWAWNSQRRAYSLLEQLRDRQGELNRTLAALTEATRRLQRINDELVFARQEAEEARALKEHFVANVSHELRTPLNLIVGFAEMMYLAPESYDGVHWTPDFENDIRELYRASQHLQSLVNDVLDLSRIDARRLPMFRELTDIRAVIADALETIAPLLRQRRLSVNTEWPDQLRQLWLDRTRFRQVMLNLLNNAVRFTDKGGISIRVEQTDAAVVVCVRDTGVGIPPGQLERIFEDFAQVDSGLRQRGGSGLGLAISRRFVQLHGGRIWAESELGKGSALYFSLPLPEAVPQTTPLLHTPLRQRVDLSQAPLIVVDPDPSVGEMLARYLGDRRVRSAKDTSEAEALVEIEHPLGIIVNEPPDTPSQSWLGTLGDLSQRCRVPIVRCSIPSPSWLRQAYGLDDCLTKPVSRQLLGQTLETHCAEPSTILVVDDAPGFVALMARMLATMPLARKVLQSYSGAQALRLAREEKPRLILLDLLMPDMSGFEVLEALRNDPELRDIAVVAVTATSYAEEMMRQQGSYLTLTQASGLSTGTLVELLNAIFGLVRPSYVVEMTSSSA